MVRPEQLTLNIQLESNSTFDNFIHGENQLLCSLLSTLSRQESQSLFLWGTKGAGRTHLLQACCHAFLESGKTVCYLEMGQLIDLSSDVLKGLESVDCVCLDDVNLLAGHRIWQEALFNLYNRIKDTATNLVIAADRAPRQLGLTLADLESRLTQCLVFHVHELSDNDKQKAIMMHINERGMHMSDEVAHYLIQHAARDMPTLLKLVDTLDKASLVTQRRLTIPFVKQFL